MTVRRVQGSEVEYGIAVQGQPHANPMVASTHVVNSYAAAHGLTRRARWDFEEENPLRDARGFDLSREVADPSQLTDEDMGLANIILTNGARLYVDHAHPEYSSPEVTNPLDVVLWEKAGENVMRLGAELAAKIPGTAPIVLYKNNVDNKGASYGAHENYLMRRDVPFDQIVEHLTPFFVSRQVFTGAGRVGQKQDGSVHAFQISQRADYFEVGVGLETTLKRPIINTRDEPHADPKKYRRLHVIIGDANCSETAIYLKHGTTSLVLAMIEAGFLTRSLALSAPVTALHDISYDPTLTQKVELEDGRTVTALELQGEYLRLAKEFVASRGLRRADRRHPAPVGEHPRPARPRSDGVRARARLGRQAGPPRALPRAGRPRLGPRQAAPRRRAVPRHPAHKGLYHQLIRTDRMDRLLTEEQIAAAVTDPPRRHPGLLPRHVPREVLQGHRRRLVGLGDLRPAGQDSLQRIPTMEPLRGTAEHVGALFETSNTASELFAAITGR